MDIGEIKPIEQVIDVLHPKTGQETGLKLTICSAEDERVKSVQREQLDKRMKGGKRRTVSQMESDNLDLLASSVVDLEWTGDANLHGEKPKHSKQVVKELLSQDWLRRQVDDAAGKTEDFYQD